MANRQTAEKRALLKDRRLDWLRSHGMTARLPTDREDVSEEQSYLLGAVVAEMVTAGLYARTTEPKDIRWGIRVLIGVLQAKGLS